MLVAVDVQKAHTVNIERYLKVKEDTREFNCTVKLSVIVFKTVLK